MGYENYMDYGSIDKILSSKDPFMMEPEEAKALRTKAVVASFLQHYFNNRVYRGFCDFYKVTPESVKTEEDVARLPLVPSDFFRDVSATGDESDIERISSVPAELIARKFTTSGTGGMPSIYPYDGKSLQTINRSNSIIFTTVGEVEPDDYFVFLSPPPEKADTGMVQGMYLSLKGILKDPSTQIRYAIPDNKLDAGYVAELVAEGEGRKRHLYGPPYAYNMVADEIAGSGLEIGLDPESKAFTTGGWKKYKGEAISPEELRLKIAEGFGLKIENIRDGLGLTDIMSILLECEGAHKHVPPWLDVSIRDLGDPTWQTRVPTGDEGLIAFISPLIGSFPAYVVTGDVGALTHGPEDRCSCGRYGPTLEYLRRAGDPRGCAMRQEQLMDQVKANR